MIGLGVLISSLGKNGGELVHAAYGKTITSAVLNKEKDRLEIRLADGTGFFLHDDGQSCCESRFMTCDDNLEEFAGSKLVCVRMKEGPCTEEPHGGDIHDTEFLEIETDRGAFTCVTHNEHNGYYGGFCLKAGSL